MKTISIRWTEKVTYEQEFEVEDDFDPTEEDLEAIVVEQADFEGAFVCCEDRECYLEEN